MKLKIKKFIVHPLSIPFTKSVNTTWSKRKGTTIFLIEIITNNNVKGYGEMISFFNHEICKKTLENMLENLTNFNLTEMNKIQKISSYDGGWMRTGQLNDIASAAWASIETAMYDAMTKEIGMPLQSFFGGEITNEFKVSVNLDVGSISSMCSKAKQLKKKGYKSLFIKVAKNNKNLEQDLKMLVSIREAVGDGISFHLDVNGAWTTQTALKAIRFLEKENFNIYCLEQPVMEIESLRYLREKSRFPIGVNELLTTPQKIFECAKKEVADIFVLDIFECGGLRNLWYISKFLNDNGYSVCCRAHGGSNLHYLTSLKILSTTDSNNITNAHQIYDFEHKNDLLIWKTKLNEGRLVVKSFNEVGNNINQTLLKKFKKNFVNGKKFEIYKNINKKNIPNFPKY